MNANAITLKRFKVVRTEDVSGTSGVGVVAEGIEWSNGWVQVHWLSQKATVEFAESIRVWIDIHGHDGRTKVEWIDV